MFVLSILHPIRGLVVLYTTIPAVCMLHYVNVEPCFVLNVCIVCIVSACESRVSFVYVRLWFCLCACEGVLGT